MSKKSIKKSLSNSVKKSKEKPNLKTYIWADVSVTPNQTHWDNQFAVKCLQNFDLSKCWKGKLFIYSQSIAVRSKNKIFSQFYEVKNIIGYLESPFNKKMMLIGILEENMTYLLIQCHEIADKLKIIKELNAYKAINESTNSTQQLDNEIDIIPSIDPVENIPESVVNGNINGINHISNYETFIEILPEDPRREEVSLQTSFVPYKEETIHLTKRIPAIIMNTELVDNTIDSFQADGIDSDSDNVMWIENTKYIDYVSALGMHAQTEDGSIYMYCAHQVIPRINEYYSDDSDSD